MSNFEIEICYQRSLFNVCQPILFLRLFYFFNLFTSINCYTSTIGQVWVSLIFLFFSDIKPTLHDVIHARFWCRYIINCFRNLMKCNHKNLFRNYVCQLYWSITKPTLHKVICWNMKYVHFIQYILWFTEMLIIDWQEASLINFCECLWESSVLHYRVHTL
jgi:hypothetical protein